MNKVTIKHITYKGIELRIAYNWYPAEPATHLYPGADEEYTIHGIYHMGENIINIFNDEQIEEIINHNLI